MTKRNTRFYSSKKWRRVRESKLSINPLCQDCETLEIIEPANHVDHVIAINDGGELFDLDNLRSLCLRCHSRKTVYRDGGLGQKKREYVINAKGCNKNGLPIDPNHHWNK